MQDNSLDWSTIGIYNAIQSDIPYVKLFRNRGISFYMLDTMRPLDLDKLEDYKLSFVLANTPFQQAKIVNYGTIRIIYIDFKVLSLDDITSIINDRMLYPKHKIEVTSDDDDRCCVCGGCCG